MSPLAAFVLGAAAMLAVVVLVLRKLAFRHRPLSDFAGQTPVFDLRRHLSGPILCEGLIYGPTGRVAARFVAEMEGTWTGDTGRLTERFRYDSGSEQRREWQLTLLPDGRIRATAADLVGEGSGEAAGPAVRLRYRLRLEPDAGGHVLDVTDWMYLCQNGTIMNRSRFAKFGLPVAELVATMRPMPATAAAGGTAPRGDDPALAAE